IRSGDTDKHPVELQRTFLDVEKNRYERNLIVNPPLHTALELDAVIERLGKVAPKGPVIDFGAGSGRLTIPLLQRGYSVLAVDVSSSSLANLEALAESLSLPSLRTSSTLPQHQKHKAIVGCDILHHIDLDEYLPVFHDLLEPEGRVIFSEPGAFNPTWYIYLPLFYDWKVEKGVTACTLPNLKKKLHKYGFRNVNITGLGLLPRPF